MSESMSAAMTRRLLPSLPAQVTRLILLWFLMGEVYFVMEIFWRIPSGGFPHWSMIIVGGLCGVSVGGINQAPCFYSLHIRIQALIGTVITLAIELISGCILNLWLGLGIWDYSHLPGNILGQICITFALIWFALMPFAIWLEDRLRWGLGWYGWKYSLWSIYKEFIFG